MTSSFDVLPAIDLRGGRVVRLEQGDVARETAFSDDPVAVARSFAEQGARWLHVVDLDGALSGSPAQAHVIAAIVGAVGERVAVEVAGGLRTEAAVASVLEAGAARAVVGTAALRDPTFAGRLVAAHGSDRIAVALDVRDGLAVGHGWVPGDDGVPVDAALAAIAAVGVTTFEATAIDRDGLLGGPDLGLYDRLVEASSGALIASAGIASAADIEDVRSLGCAGAIVGRALYDGGLMLGDALAAAARERVPVRRPADREVLGAIQRATDGTWLALSVFGGTLGVATSAGGARRVVEAEGLASLARRWFYRARSTGTWEVVVIQEAWPGRARLVVGAYALAGAPTIVVTADDLAAGDILTLDPPEDADLDQFRN